MSNIVWPKDTIYWQTFHTPPVTIQIGKYKNQGFVDRMLNIIKQELPEYKHVHPLTTHSRAMESMRLGKNVCHPAMFMTEERKKFAYFSKISIISPAITLITKKAVVERLNIKEPVNLQNIFEQQELVIGLVHSRSYGKQTDTLINNYPASRFIRLPIEEGDKMFSLISNNKLSFTFSYPFELSYFTETTGQGKDLIALEVEGEALFSTGNMACSKTPWGKEVIAKINAVLLKIRAREDYVTAMTSWINKEYKWREFQAFMKHAYESEED